MKYLEKFRSFAINRNWLRRLLQIVLFLSVTALVQGNLEVSAFVATLVFWYLNPKEQKLFEFNINKLHYLCTIGDRIISSKSGAYVVLPDGVSLPHIFVDMHSNDSKFGVVPNFKDIFPQKLEASFGKETTIYAKHNERTEILTILNPKVMEAIYLYAKSFDVEFSGGHFILFSRERLTRHPARLIECQTAIYEITKSLNQMFVNMQVREQKTFGTMSVVPSDRTLKIGSYRLGSIRRITCNLLVLAVTYVSYSRLIETLNDNIKNGQAVMQAIIISLWIIVVFPALYIGYSNKKIDIKF